MQTKQYIFIAQLVRALHLYYRGKRFPRKPRIFSGLPFAISQNVYLRNKTCSPCLHSLVKTEANVWENSRAENSHKLCRGFRQAMETRTCFISFIKLLISLLTKRKTIYEVGTVHSYNLEPANHIAHVIFVLHSAMKTHL